LKNGPSVSLTVGSSPIVTETGGRKLLRQGSVGTGQFPRRRKNAAAEQKSTAIGFRLSVHEHDQNQDQRLA
jgi:hypothetical protein